MMEAAEVLLMADIMKFTSDLTDWSDDTKATPQLVTPPAFASTRCIG